MAYRRRRRTPRRHRHGAFTVQPKRLWYHRYQHIASTISQTDFYYQLLVFTGVDDNAKLVKDIHCDILMAPAVDTSPPYGNTGLNFAWLRRPKNASDSDISDDDSLRIWRPRPVGLLHTPDQIGHRITMRWPRIMISEDDVFKLVVWADAVPTGLNTYVSCTSHYMEAEHQGSSSALLARLEKLEAASSPPSV